MKRLICLLAAVTMMTACAKKNDTKSESANPSELQGKYELDLTSLINDEMSDDNGMAKAVANFLLSKMHLTMEFNGDKITLDASGNLKKLLSFADEEDLSDTEYKLVDDSLLYTRNQEDEWREAGVLRRIEGSDDLQWVVEKEEDGSETILLLRKK